jgi:hypothetical protein
LRSPTTVLRSGASPSAVPNRHPPGSFSWIALCRAAFQVGADFVQRVEDDRPPLQEMMIGRSDEPGRATAITGRSTVVVWFAEPVRASGQRAASAGRTHDRHPIAQEIQ